VGDGSDGPQTGPVGERAGRSGKPPVPRPVASDLPATPEGQHRTERVPFPLPGPAGTAPDDGAGRHRTEQVPFPLPPLPPQGRPDPAPETGRLFLGEYPPRVPGSARAGSGGGGRDAAPASPGEDPDSDTGDARRGR
jgi:hypothetical protein